MGKEKKRKKNSNLFYRNKLAINHSFTITFLHEKKNKFLFFCPKKNVSKIKAKCEKKSTNNIFVVVLVDDRV